MAKKTQKEVRKDAFLKIGMGFLVLLLIVNTIQLSNFGGIVERVDGYNRGVVDELGGFRQDIVAFGTDINEMRSYLLLPTRDYSFMEKETEIETEEAKEASTTERALYQFLSIYADEQMAQKNLEAARERINVLSGDQTLREQLSQKELTAGPVEHGEETSMFKILSARDPLFAVIADSSGSAVRVQSVLGTHELAAASAATDLASYATQNKEKVIALKQLLEAKKTGIINLAGRQDVRQLLNEKKVTFNAQPEEDDKGFHYHFMNSEETSLMSIDLLRDGNYGLKDKTFESEEQLAASLLEELQKVDALTTLERLIAQRRAELETIFQETAFQELLASSGLTVAPEPREDYNKLLYDVKNAEGGTVFSFVIEMESGLFKVLKDNEEIDLSSLLIGSKKKP